jgi:hypothetical protein
VTNSPVSSGIFQKLKKTRNQPQELHFPGVRLPAGDVASGVRKGPPDVVAHDRRPGEHAEKGEMQHGGQRNATRVHGWPHRRAGGEQEQNLRRHQRRRNAHGNESGQVAHAGHRGQDDQVQRQPNQRHDGADERQGALQGREGNFATLRVRHEAENRVGAHGHPRAVQLRKFGRRHLPQTGVQQNGAVLKQREFVRPQNHSIAIECRVVVAAELMLVPRRVALFFAPTRLELGAGVAGEDGVALLEDGVPHVALGARLVAHHVAAAEAEVENQRQRARRHLKLWSAAVAPVEGSERAACHSGHVVALRAVWILE